MIRDAPSTQNHSQPLAFSSFWDLGGYLKWLNPLTFVPHTPVLFFPVYDLFLPPYILSSSPHITQNSIHLVHTNQLQIVSTQTSLNTQRERCWTGGRCSWQWCCSCCCLRGCCSKCRGKTDASNSPTFTRAARPFSSTLCSTSVSSPFSWSPSKFTCTSVELIDRTYVCILYLSHLSSFEFIEFEG